MVVCVHGIRVPLLDNNFHAQRETFCTNTVPTIHTRDVLNRSIVQSGELTRASAHVLVHLCISIV